MEQLAVKEKFSEAQIQSFVQTRQTFLLAKFQPEVAKAEGITYWEQITCIGYNPDLSRLEAIVRVKQATGYNGGLCSIGSHEFVRFFVDYQDGHGFHDAGVASFKVADIPNAGPAPKHPLNYMANLFLNDEAHRKFTSCDVAVMPKVRAVLSWNSVPSLNPFDTPHFGNILDADIQLKRKSGIFFGDLVKELDIADKLHALPPVDKKTAVPVINNPLPPVEEFHQFYKAAGIPDQRTFYSSIIPQLHEVAKIPPGTHSYDVNTISKMGINIGELAKIIAKPVIIDNNKADVTYEELTCVGLNTDTDTLGAVIKIKKTAGFSGNLCTAGSKEYVAFWADWNDNGTFDEYLGTASVNVHDIKNIPAEGLYYNVALQIDPSKYLKNCITPNVIKIRGVLSWQSLPSTTNPDVLNYYGNRVDALAQLRPGQPHDGQVGLNLFDINGIAISSIDQANASPTQGLAKLGVYPATDQPFGGLIKLSGLFTNSGPSGSLFYKVQFSDNNGATWQDILDKQRFQIIEGGVLTLVDQDPSSSSGWIKYLPAVPDKAEKLSMLIMWDSGNRNGLHKLKVTYTKDPLHVSVKSEERFIYLDNTGFKVNNAPSTMLDASSTLDVVIAGGDCKFYKKGDVISGQLKVTDQFFSGWAFDIQPSAHIQPAGTPLSTFVIPAARSCSGLADHGDNNNAFTINTQYLQSCGYSIRLYATDRALVGYKIPFLDGSYIYNITSHYAEKYLGFAVLP